MPTTADIRLIDNERSSAQIPTTTMNWKQNGRKVGRQHRKRARPVKDRLTDENAYHPISVVHGSVGAAGGYASHSATGQPVALHIRGLLWVKTRIPLRQSYVSQLRTSRHMRFCRLRAIGDLSRCSNARRQNCATRSPHRQWQAGQAER